MGDAACTPDLVLVEIELAREEEGVEREPVAGRRDVRPRDVGAGGGAGSGEEQQGALVIEKQHNGLQLIQTVAANQLLQGELRLVNETAQVLHGLIQSASPISR